MAKHKYPITDNYIPEWTVAHAIREIVANGLDAEIEHGASFSAAYDSGKERLVLKNQGTKLSVSSLYFGESSKRHDSRVIGQYGEGLKLALLVLARERMDVTIKNGTDETWKATLERDGNDMNCLVINITKASRAANDVEVSIEGVPEALWDEMRTWFLRLHPASTVHKTTAGELLDDPEFMGRIFVRGVYVTKRPGYDFGYNFYNLDTGRDRRIPNSWTLDTAIAEMWSEVSARDDAAMQQRMYKALKNQSSEEGVFAYTMPPKLVDTLVNLFKDEYGEQAVPVTGTSEGMDLGHIGHVAVPLPHRLVALLRQRMQDPSSVIKGHSESVKTRWAAEDLNGKELTHLAEALQLIIPDVPNAPQRTIVVSFGTDTVEGLHKGEEVLLSRAVLQNFGKTVMVLVHEFAHDKGGDGSAEHVNAIHVLSEAVINRLRRGAWPEPSKPGA